ncbi:uncharacterized protein LOC120841077 [Ixodes scapularis]|uniref:uncharacterized protein LOC120841077 n=1 Tax=Ixodes scapularis TaxID=6945 RepID=UPI001C38422F|nr:uncharacterized protein LOC120841077 [Ixodes scapularis]
MSNSIMNDAGMSLRKWASNDKHVQHIMNEVEADAVPADRNLKLSRASKVLEMIWHKDRDSFSGDLAKQLELVDAKVEEVDTLKEKFEAPQLELGRFSAEYCILQDVLLQEYGEDLPVVENDSEQREFSAFQYIKKLLDIAKRKREALENQLAKKEEQFNLLQQNYQYLEDRYQWPLQDLAAFVRSIIGAFVQRIIEHTNQSSEAAVSLEASQLEDLNCLLAVLQERVKSLTVRNEPLAQESQQRKSFCEDASEKIRCVSYESRLWQQRHGKVAETLRERENVVKRHNSSQTEADGSSITEKAETECDRVDEKVSSLLKRNGKLEIDADVLRSELSSPEEQGEMLVSDNKHFQQLAENLEQARHCLEEELKTLCKQHVRATKEMENEHSTALDVAAKCEAALRRNQQEEFHAAAREKHSLEDRCAQLTEEWATARRALAVFEEKQGAVGQKTRQELQELWQANQQLQERFRCLKDKHLKAEERLVQAPNQKLGASMEHVTEDTGGATVTTSKKHMEQQKQIQLLKTISLQPQTKLLKTMSLQNQTTNHLKTFPRLQGQQNGQKTTRSGRVVVKPLRYRD